MFELQTEHCLNLKKNGSHCYKNNKIIIVIKDDK